MAASGCTEDKSGEEEMSEMSVSDSFELIGMVQKNGLFNGTFVYSDISSLCKGQNGSAIAKCIERLNELNKVNGTGVAPSIPNNIELKKTAGPLTHRPRNDRNSDVFNSERRTLRFDRSGSTDSVAVSSGGSDHGGSDTCQSSSSDTTSVSDPCSPEAPPESTSRPSTPQPMPPIPPSLAEEENHHHQYHRNHHHHLEEEVRLRRSETPPAIVTCERTETVKESIVPDEEHQQQTVRDVALSPDKNISPTVLSSKLLPDQTLSESVTKVPETNNQVESAIQSEQNDCLPTTVEPSANKVNGDDAWCCSSTEIGCKRLVCSSSSSPVVETDSPRVPEPGTTTTNTKLATTTVVVEKADLVSPVCVVKEASNQRHLEESGVKNVVKIVDEEEEEEEGILAAMSEAPSASRSDVMGGFCKWKDCQRDVECSDKLMEHIRSFHVDAQVGNENYVCLWVGCKVFNRPSCSVSWLERHILSHGGNKPFKCIVDGCEHRFASQSALERHVNSHFNSSTSQSSASAAGGSGKAGKTKEDTPTKLMKKKKQKYRTRCWAVKTEDYFDSGIMEHVRYDLMQMESNCKLDTFGASRMVTFHSHVIARRVESSGKVNVLLHWTPEDVLPDSWIFESQMSENVERSVPLSLLPRQALFKLDPSLEAYSPPKRRRK